jgi:hypothetical protein
MRATVDGAMNRTTHGAVPDLVVGEDKEAHDSGGVLIVIGECMPRLAGVGRLVAACVALELEPPGSCHECDAPELMARGDDIRPRSTAVG